MPVQNVEDLFVYGLSTLYDAEQNILKTLEQVVDEVNDDRVRNAIRHHQDETRQQVQNLERCFDLIGYQPQRVTCYVVQGIKQEHDAFMQESPPRDVLTAFNVCGALKTEHIEITAYRDLINKAELLGLRECTRLLRENLSQEEEMARKVEQIGRQLDQETIGRSGRRAA